MSKFLATSVVYLRAAAGVYLRVAAIALAANLAVIAVGVGTIFAIATVASKDQRVYNGCMIKHKSADYCRLIVSGR